MLISFVPHEPSPRALPSDRLESYQLCHCVLTCHCAHWLGFARRGRLSCTLFQEICILGVSLHGSLPQVQQQEGPPLQYTPEVHSLQPALAPAKIQVIARYMHEDDTHAA